MSKYLVNTKTRKIFNGVIPKYENSIIYSTEEKIIGIWNDGRPLYGRSFYVDGDIGLEIEMQSCVDICLLDPSHSYYTEKNGILWGIGIVDNDGITVQTRTYYDVTNNQHLFRYVKPSSRNILKSVITLNYTKTTDNS